jgi:transcriptional regulator with XRE-family HTH domain
MSIVAKKVSHYIKEKGWSIPTLSKKSGLSQSAIKKIIYATSKNQRMETLEKLAAAFGCGISDLVTDNNHQTASSQEKTKDKWNAELFKYCIDLIESRLQKRNINCDKQKAILIIENLYSLLIKKESDKIKGLADPDLIDWIINNSIS